MANQPVQHHFLPAFYLARFTEGHARTSRFYVFDKERKKRRLGTPDSEAKERYFYTPQFEQTFQQLEGRWSKAVSATIKGGAIPPGDLGAELIFFVGMTVLRSRRMRQWLGQAADASVRKPARAIATSDESRNALRAALEKEGVYATDEEFAAVIALMKSGEYTVSATREYHQVEMIELAKSVIPELGKRHWKLWKVEAGASDLVCSNNPVNLIPFAATPVGNIGFGTADTLLVMPLDRRTVLVSSLERLPPRNTLEQGAVARMNYMQSFYGEQLFSAGPDFTILLNDGQVGTALQLFSSWGF